MKMILTRFIFLIPTKTEEQNSEFYIHVLERLLKQILRERQLVFLEQICPLSFCLDYGVLPGELQRDGGPVTLLILYSSDLTPAYFPIFWKWIMQWNKKGVRK
jgi:inorganic pyrophosphatase